MSFPKKITYHRLFEGESTKESSVANGGEVTGVCLQFDRHDSETFVYCFLAYAICETSTSSSTTNDRDITMFYIYFCDHHNPGDAV